MSLIASKLVPLPSIEVGNSPLPGVVVQSASAVLILLLRIPAAGYHGWVLAADTCKYEVICICMGGRSCGVVVEERRRGAAGRLGLVLGLGSV